MRVFQVDLQCLVVQVSRQVKIHRHQGFHQNCRAFTVHPSKIILSPRFAKTKIYKLLFRTKLSCPLGASIAEQSITAQIPNWLKEKKLLKKNYALLSTGFCLAEASKISYFNVILQASAHKSDCWHSKKGRNQNVLNSYNSPTISPSSRPYSYTAGKNC